MSYWNWVAAGKKILKCWAELADLWFATFSCFRIDVGFLLQL